MTQSRELRVATKIADLVSDLRLDFDILGGYLADLISNVTLSRIIYMVEVAESIKEEDGIEVLHY
jgi:hypothetical protein